MDNIGPLKILAANEMLDIKALPASEKCKYIIAGYVDFIYKQIILFRADGIDVRVSFDVFIPSANCEPNFNELEIIDYGQTIKLGEYEAAAYPLIMEDSLIPKDIN